MSEHFATVEWRRTTPDFKYPTYDRTHRLRFDDGLEIAGTGARANIPASAPYAPGVDPEQALVAAVSSCHMLWFLHMATDAKLVVDSYTDHAVGILAKNRDGKMAITRVTLRPAVAFGAGVRPTPQQLHELHEKAHECCFIANSVKSEIVVEPVFETKE